MGLFDMVLDRLAAALGKRIQGYEQHAAYRDSGKKGTDYSVESMVCESLANLMMLEYSMPIEGAPRGPGCSTRCPTRSCATRCATRWRWGS